MKKYEFISLTDIRERLPDIVTLVSYGETEVILTRHGKGVCKIADLTIEEKKLCINNFSK